VYSIVAKFFLDSLTHYECIPDDNDEYIGTEIYNPTFDGEEEEYCRIDIIENGNH